MTLRYLFGWYVMQDSSQVISRRGLMESGLEACPEHLNLRHLSCHVAFVALSR
jgi:hypothetical protein